jgi:hypothetical protein
VGHPFETGFESDVCRSTHNGLAIAFVTAAMKKFRQGLFRTASGFAM